MSSAIDPTKPVAGNPTTESVRDNFAAAKAEIEALQPTFGTWTPALEFNTKGDLAITYSSRYGLWLKQGKLLHYSFQIIMSAMTFSTATGNAVITGLPFSATSRTGYLANGALTLAGMNVGAMNDAVARINTAVNFFTVIGLTSANTYSAAPVSMFASGTPLRLNASGIIELD